MQRRETDTMGIEDFRKKNIENYMFPSSAEEMKRLGWEQADIIIVNGDAFVDHPAFGVAIIARVLQNHGYKVAIIAQPNWRDDLRDFKKMGKPRLFFAISSGNMDSMVNHYTARKRLRSDDAYTPGGKAGFRPDYAVQVYSDIIRKLFPDSFQLLGGIEASLRRTTHYDYWSDSLKPSLLFSTTADALIYGMAENAIVSLAQCLSSNPENSSWKEIPQLAFRDSIIPENSVLLPSFIDCKKSPAKFGEHFIMLEKWTNRIKGKILVDQGQKDHVIINPSATPLNSNELDSIYNLPFTRLPHPRYKRKENIPAWEMIRDSITLHRGCLGGCSFCALTMHQGRTIQSRSLQSIENETEQLIKVEGFKGTISDLGGPSANMFGMSPLDSEQCARCHRPSCIYPSLCKNLSIDYSPLIELYNIIRNKKGIDHAYISSGIRYDLIFDDKTFLAGTHKYFDELISYHISGRLKVAPEHTEEKILKLMRKPSFQQFKVLLDAYRQFNAKKGQRRQLIPYLITGFPGNTIDDAANMASKIFKLGIFPEQIQDFTPTPMTLASVMFYLGSDPYSGQKLYIAKDIEEKRMQNDLLLSHRTEVRKKIIDSLPKIKNTEIRKRIARLFQK